MKFHAARVTAILCALTYGATLAVHLGSSGFVRTGDRNSDGRPDVWQWYDARGQLVRVADDTNFDGRADEITYYTHGEPVRREFDRNFDHRIDLVEDFDLVTYEPRRSRTDVDFDGTADLLVLLQDGRPVFSEERSAASRAMSAHVHAVSASRADRDPPDGLTAGDLLPLADPFSSDTVIRYVTLDGGTNPTPCLPSFKGLPIGSPNVIEPPIAPAARSAPYRAHPRSRPTLPRSPRGPPSASLV